jgi:hypothetical protein
MQHQAAVCCKRQLKFSVKFLLKCLALITTDLLAFWEVTVKL